MSCTQDDPMIIDDGVPGNSQGWRRSWTFANENVRDQDNDSSSPQTHIDLTDCEQDPATETVSRNGIRRPTGHGDHLITGRPMEQCEIEGVIRLQRLNDRSNAITIDDDPEADDSPTNQARVSGRDPNSRRFRPPTREDLIIDLEEEEGVLYDELPSTPQPARQSRGSRASPERNDVIELPHLELEELFRANFRLKSGKTVELKNGDFIYIKHIITNLQDDEVKIRGHLLKRHKHLSGMFPRKLNELCWCLDVDANDPRPPEVQSMVEEPLSAILRPRRTIFTNRAFPELHNHGLHNTPAETLNEGVLIVRWKYTRIYNSASERRNGGRVSEHIVERLREGPIKGLEEAISNSLADDKLRTQFRGNTVRGGEYCSAEQTSSGSIIRGSNILRRPSPDDLEIAEISEAEFDTTRGSRLQEESDAELTTGVSRICISGRRKFSQRKYTYGDCFCGVGGATRGAVMAGLEPIWGFDSDESAGKAWHANFSQARLYLMWADEFIQRALNNPAFRVDVLHISPPCQFFSPAHTINGPNDDMNSATLFSIGHLLDAAKPRVVTLEQTFGLCSPRFQGFFYSVISFFTERNFSVRWKICHLQEWGLPQRRLRLIMIASCPGEALPEFPPFTHSQYPSGDLKPYNSVNSVLRTVTNQRSERELRQPNFIPRIPWNGDSIAPRCITTSGGQNYHPSGLRNFTIPEYAALQGFPPNHQFGESRMLRQVGNAWAPCIAKIIFESVITALEKADGIVGRRRSGSTADSAVLIA